MGYDGRETAPAAATPDQFMKLGKPLAFMDAVTGGLSVGTPGVISMMAMAHAKHGKLPWAALFQPAIELAEKGFRCRRGSTRCSASWRSASAPRRRWQRTISSPTARRKTKARY
jgi:gamma-glutamyltranspeptidase